MLSNTPDHAHKVAAIQAQVKSRVPGKKVRINHGSSNSTRQTAFDGYCVVDTSGLDGVIEINVAKKYVIVEPSIQMDRLVEATLKHSLLPPVVMEFPGISVGGGVQGGAAESSSFKYSGFHHSALAYEMVLGDGSVIVATPDKYQDLFWGTSCSYGTLGILTAVKLRLIDAKPYVCLQYTKCNALTEAIKLFDHYMEHPDEIDYLDAIMYSPTNIIVMAGTFAAASQGELETFLKPSDEWFYIHAAQIMRHTSSQKLWVPTQDYLFRYDRGAFWVGALVFKRLKLPFIRLTRRVLDKAMHTRFLYRGVQQTNVSQQYLAQDIFMPKEHVVDFVAYIQSTLHIWPLWLLPMRKHNQPLDIFGLPYTAADYVINVGVWGETDAKNFTQFRALNRSLEKMVIENHAHKTLYAHSYFSEEEFWKIYDKQQYEALRKKYHADEAFADIYDKVTVTKQYTGLLSGAIAKALLRRMKRL